ncbi:MAG: hypothetical protein CSA38_01040 [Flavobacteriales bacterium]|nr:MAG: hypothetical protein CSA38_01040 [Flavobacteriales bacterium]
MRKNWYLLLLGFLFLSVSCIVDRDRDSYIDNDTIATVYDLRNINFTYTNSDGWTIYKEFLNPLVGSDMLLIYRMSDTTNNGSPVWQQIPRTLYLSQGELDYDFDFSRDDIRIMAGGNYDISTTPAFLENQTFRIVIVPGSTTGTSRMDFSDYEAVAEHFNLKNVKIQQL